MFKKRNADQLQCTWQVTKMLIQSISIKYSLTMFFGVFLFSITNEPKTRSFKCIAAHRYRVSFSQETLSLNNYIEAQQKHVEK